MIRAVFTRYWTSAAWLRRQWQTQRRHDSLFVRLDRLVNHLLTRHSDLAAAEILAAANLLSGLWLNEPERLRQLDALPILTEQEFHDAVCDHPMQWQLLRAVGAIRHDPPVWRLTWPAVLSQHGGPR
jgi:hypothetical protein